jgi:hypothetical protein
MSITRVFPLKKYQLKIYSHSRKQNNHIGTTVIHFSCLKVEQFPLKLILKRIALPSSVIYVHPDQVHRIVAFKDVTVCSLGNHQ